jgi:hypothetical protein
MGYETSSRRLCWKHVKTLLNLKFIYPIRTEKKIWKLKTKGNFIISFHTIFFHVISPFTMHLVQQLIRFLDSSQKNIFGWDLSHSCAASFHTHLRHNFIGADSSVVPDILIDKTVTCYSWWPSTTAITGIRPTSLNLSWLTQSFCHNFH